MWDVTSRIIYCPKADQAVTITEYACHGQDCDGLECQPVTGILGCSNQEDCALWSQKRNCSVYPWGKCPACKPKTGS
jgi:hypothetical protein